MKISYSWLKEHIALQLPAQDLADHLLKLGFEVVDIRRLGPAFSGVVAAEILSIDKHPNADRLSLCKVSDGSATLSVVCGAKNIAVGQRVPLARVGATLPGGFKIARSKIRGVESEGMICSQTELGLGQNGDGIMVMDPAVAVGADVAGLLGRADEILDVEVTPNRPDCLSHLGLARELSAFFRVPLCSRPEAALPAPRGEAPLVRNEEVKACPRYVGRLLRDLKVGPSPGWLSRRLESVGLRAINNVVDATNFILMDMGQPLHAFDLAALEGGAVVVRYAAAGESLKALDGRDYSLTPECLVIADLKKPAAIAGVMGGEPSGVTAKTADVFLESAAFAPEAVRKTSQLLRLRSDSSYRFERGCDPWAPAAASERAAALILSLCGPQAGASAALDVHPEPEIPSAIRVSTERVNAILGSALGEPQVEAALKSIAHSLSKNGRELQFFPPSWRRDLSTPWDLAEEVARLHGYDSIAPRIPAAPLRPAHDTPAHAVSRRVRDRLAALGLCEAYNYDFVSESLLARGRLDAGPALARVRNPLNEDWTILRPSLLPGLLQNAAFNLDAGASSVRLFELGKAYRKDASAVAETSALAGVLLGPRAQAHWRDKPGESGFFEAKGALADLLAGLEGLRFTAARPAGPAGPLYHPKACLTLSLPEGELGGVGLLHPAAARAWGLERMNPAVFEINLELLAGLDSSRMKTASYSPFPSSRRDLSFVLDAAVPYAEIEAAVRGVDASELTAVELVDVFAGKGIPDGKRSLTVRLHFGLMDRTLKDAEVNAAVDKILAELKARFQAQLRS